MVNKSVRDSAHAPSQPTLHRLLRDRLLREIQPTPSDLTASTSRIEDRLVDAVRRLRVRVELAHARGLLRTER